MTIHGIDFGMFGPYAAGSVKRTKRDYLLAGDKLSWWMAGGAAPGEF